MKIASVGALVLLLMLAAVGLMQSNQSGLLTLSQEQARSQEIGEQIHDLLIALIDMETGVRGYVITQDPNFLEPYHQGIATYPITLDRLEQILGSESEQGRRLLQLRNLVGLWSMGVLAHQVEQVVHGETLDDRVEAQIGKGLMDQIRTVIHAVEQEESQAVRSLAIKSGRLASFSKVVLPVAVLVAIALSLALAIVLSRSITRPVQSLIEAVDVVADGGLGHTVPVTSQDEIGRLATRFNQMSGTLLNHQEEIAAQTEELEAQQEELTAQNEELIAQQEMLNSAMSQLERDRDHLTLLNRLAQELVASGSLATLCKQLLESLLAAGEAQVGALALLHPVGELEIAAHIGLTDQAAGVTRAAGLLQRVIETGAPLLASFPEGELLRPVYHTTVPVAHEYYLPIRFEDRTLAVAVLGRTAPAPFTQKNQDWLHMIASQAAASLSALMAQELVRAERDNLSAILRATSEGICLVDEGGQILRVNRRFWELTGIAPNLALTLGELRQAIRAKVKDQEAENADLDALHNDPLAERLGLIELAEPDGLVLQRHTTPVYAEDGGLLGRLIILRDVSREVEIDRMKTEFISTVSHELRTPLTSIRGYVELILDGDVGPISEQQREFLELVTRSSVRLANLIDDLLDVEKIEQGRIQMRQEPVDMGAILAEATATFRISAAEKGLTLALEIERPLPAIQGDPERLAQLFNNLISNAVKYTKQGEIHVHAWAEADQLIVDVADTGIGIAPEHLANLFTRFYRAENHYTREVGGTGLGLAISRAVAQHHGGWIEVESEAGKGSRFRTILPVGAESQLS